MRPLNYLAVLALVVCWQSAVAGAGIKIIANPSVSATSTTVAELKDVYLRVKSTLSDGSRVEPVLAKSGEAHATFVKEYLCKSESALVVYYRSLVFSGRGELPVTLDGDAEIIAYVSKTKGAIAYVSASAQTARVKTLNVIK